ncbi:MAG: nucleotide exchange factor GrpE [Pseudomonadota bacterium]
MTNETDRPETEQDIPEHLAPEKPETEPFGGVTSPEQALEIIEALQAESAELKDRLLRTAAELDNVRRRAEKEKSDAARYGIANFAKDLVSVADNMERALAALPEEAAAEAGEAVKGLVTGVQMTERELLSCLERHGVKRIHPKGEKFDPNIHQAIAEVPGNGAPQGTVVDVAQTGFVIGERVLRAAMVTVSNGEGAPPAGGDAPAGGHVDTTA